MSQHAEATARLVKRVQGLEHDYMLHGGRNTVTLPYMPFQPASFIGIVWECMPEIGDYAFLDVGCGPGAKMAIATQVFGLRASGVEIDSVLAEEAKTYGPVRTADALSLEPEFYADADIIWLYRPFRDPAFEHKLEQLIISGMKPGAVLAGGAWETEIPQLGWHTIVDDWEVRQGAWQKP